MSSVSLGGFPPNVCSHDEASSIFVQADVAHFSCVWIMVGYAMACPWERALNMEGCYRWKNGLRWALCEFAIERLLLHVLFWWSSRKSVFHPMFPCCAWRSVVDGAFKLQSTCAWLRTECEKDLQVGPFLCLGARHGNAGITNGTK